MRVRFGPLLAHNKAKSGKSLTEISVGSVEKDLGGQRHHVFMVYHVRVWIATEPLQFKWFRAAMWL